MSSVKTGVFGKIPKRGDFVSIGLPRSFTDAFVVWVRQGLEQAKQKDEWQGIYFSSPIWQFSTAKNFWDTQSWTGLIMPSVDSVGRNFPLVIASSTSSVNAHWLAQAQTIALQALAVEDFKFDIWKSHLLSLFADVVPAEECALAAPAKGAFFRAMSASNDEIYSYHQEQADARGYADLVLSGLKASQQEEALI